MKWIVACSLLAVAAYGLAELQESQEPALKYRPEGPDGGKFLLGVLRTNVISIGSTTTITVAAATCHNGIPTATTCSGRKKRMALPELPEVKPGNFEQNLGSSMKEEVEAAPEEGNKDGVQRLVIWTTSTTTLTFTSSSTASGTTLSLSYYCTASGISAPSAC